MGPGPSSSHTMGPMRITYDFFQRVSALPPDQLKRATGLKVHLYGSLSATGKGHGTDRASLAGLLGKAPATCPPEFLDGLAAKPDQSYKVNIGPASLDLSLKDVIFDATKGDFHHPNTMTAVLLAGDETLLVLDWDDTLLEASRANAFAVFDGTLVTPPADGRILPGIARARALEIAAENGIEVREAALRREDLTAADELFLTGSVRGVERVQAVDGTELDAAGEVASTIHAGLRRAWLGAGLDRVPRR